MIFLCFTLFYSKLRYCTADIAVLLQIFIADFRKYTYFQQKIAVILK